MLDDTLFLRSGANTEEEPTPALLCDLIAIAVPFWSRSSKLGGIAQPDPAYVWNLAAAALQNDFMAPSISTVQGAMLDMIGRPVYSIVWNIYNVGRTTALAHSFGLHRDPTTWKISENEKRRRIKTWWGLFINDKW